MPAMNVLLIQPRIKKSEKAYPLGLGYVGAALIQRGHKVWGRDLSFTSLDAVYSLIDRENIGLIIASVMFYGINQVFYDFKNVLSFCRKIKDNNPLPIVLGGLYARAFKEKLFYEYKDYFDYLILGEDEFTISELADSLDEKRPLKEIDNLIFKDNGQMIINKCANKILNLDCYPYIDRKLFPIFKYKGMFTKNNNYTQIITSRGCNWHCSYCPQPFLEGTWKGFSIGRVIDEIRSITATFGIREFHIEDANFFGGGTERVKNFCLKLIENKLDIKWQCPNGIPVSDFKDESILKLMVQAGCYSLCLGIETFDRKILERVNRVSDFKAVQRIVRLAQKEGLEVTGYFIIGFPGQTKKSIKRDIYLSRKLGLDFIHYSIFRLIPGSEIYSDYHKDLDTREGTKKNRYFPELTLGALRRSRTLASLFNCLQPRVFLFILKSLIIVRNPFRFLRRGIGYLLGIDLKF